MVQTDCAGRLVPQLFPVIVNVDPLSVMELIVSGVLLAFERVRSCSAPIMVKFNDEVSVMEPAGGGGGGLIPFTDKDTNCGEFAAVDWMTRVAVRAPRADGVASTCTVQLLPAFTTVPQPGLTIEKSEPLTPPKERPLSDMKELPVFWMVTV